MNILNETYFRYYSISLPAYWIMVGVCHVLGLKKHQNFSDVRHIRAGNLYFHLSEVLRTGYSQNDTEDFIATYREFLTRILSLVDSVDRFIDFKMKKLSPTWLLKKISDLLFSNPIARMDALTALAVEQKESNPIEAGYAYLHKAAIICEMLRYAPMPGSELVPQRYIFTILKNLTIKFYKSDYPDFYLTYLSLLLLIKLICFIICFKCCYSC